ncbi:MAG: hypothetical protein ACRBEE_09185 [Arenicella sp.]
MFKQGFYYGAWGPLFGAVLYYVGAILWLLMNAKGDYSSVKIMSEFFPLLIFAYLFAGIPAFLTGIAAHFLGKQNIAIIGLIGGFLSFWIFPIIFGEIDMKLALLFGAIGAISACVLAKINVKRDS